jgi:hypothetical protein
LVVVYFSSRIRPHGALLPAFESGIKNPLKNRLSSSVSRLKRRIEGSWMVVVVKLRFKWVALPQRLNRGYENLATEIQE